MTDELVVTGDAPVPVPVFTSFDTSLAAERAAERTLMQSIVRSVAIGLPLGIAFFIAILGLAVGDQLAWWTIIGLGVALGVVGAVLFGMLGGVTLAAHVFEDVDRGTTHPHS